MLAIRFMVSQKETYLSLNSILGNFIYGYGYLIHLWLECEVKGTFFSKFSIFLRHVAAFIAIPA